MSFDPGAPRSAKYGTAHTAERKARVAVHQPTHLCTRCKQPLGPMGSHLHLDHREDGGYLGFAHASCNVKAGARKGSMLSHAQRKAASAFQRRAW